MADTREPRPIRHVAYVPRHAEQLRAVPLQRGLRPIILGATLPHLCICVRRLSGEGQPTIDILMPHLTLN